LDGDLVASAEFVDFRLRAGSNLRGFLVERLLEFGKGVEI
jgi:hypothetical protein